MLKYSQYLWKHKSYTAKSIADRIDIGLIMLRVNEKDMAKINEVLEANPRFKPPTIKISVYKNRRGAYTGCYLWCAADMGTCRIEPQFCTKWDYTLLPIEDIKIIVDRGPAPWDDDN